MIPWLIDTLYATGFLMAIVLLLRRPVARAFGPGLAYALWALPLIRMILPPLVLPASFAPKEDVPASIHDVLVIATPRAIAESAQRSSSGSRKAAARISVAAPASQAKLSAGRLSVQSSAPRSAGGSTVSSCSNGSSPRTDCRSFLSARRA